MVSSKSKNVYLQAKRLSNILNISLSKAKTLLSKALYQCNSYSELCEKIYKNDLKSKVYPFSKLHPKAGEDLVSYLTERMESVITRFSKFLKLPISPLKQHSFVYSIFGLEIPYVSSFTVPSVLTEGWRNYNCDFFPNNAVMHYDVMVNSTPVRILAVRIFPQELREYSTNHKVAEGVLNSDAEDKEQKLQWILWDKDEAYRTALEKARLTETNEELQSVIKEMQLSVPPQNSEQKKFQHTFDNIFNYFEDNVIGTTLRLHVLGNDTYVLLGYPVKKIVTGSTNPEIYVCGDNITCKKYFFHFCNDVVCLCMENIKPKNSKTLQLLQNEFNDLESFSPTPISIGEKYFHIYIRSATKVESNLFAGETIRLI